jgi:hypothetical protein
MATRAKPHACLTKPQRPPLPPLPDGHRSVTQMLCGAASRAVNKIRRGRRGVGLGTGSPPFTAYLSQPELPRALAKSAIASAIFCIPAAMFGRKAASTSVTIAAAFSPRNSSRWMRRVRPSAIASNRHWHEKIAPSICPSIVAKCGGWTSLMIQCRGGCPGIRVVPSDPTANGPSNSNSAGGSDQFAMLVQKSLAKA